VKNRVSAKLTAGNALRDVRPIAVNVEADPVYLPSDKAVSVGLMVNELATNAFKYAFPDDQAGTITVRFRNKSARQLELIVGLPDDYRVSSRRAIARSFCFAGAAGGRRSKEKAVGMSGIAALVRCLTG